MSDLLQRSCRYTSLYLSRISKRQNGLVFWKRQFSSAAAETSNAAASTSESTTEMTKEKSAFHQNIDSLMASTSERELWRLDTVNPFQVVPQTWVVGFDDMTEYKMKIIQLHPQVFRVKPRLDLLHRNLQWQKDYRSVTFVKALTRAELPYTHRKPWPQLRSGRGHAGSIREPHFIMGGSAHGIRGPLTYFYMLPDSVRLEGLCVALTIKHAQDDLVIVSGLDNVQHDNGYMLHKMIERRNWGYSVLFVIEDDIAPKMLAKACAEVPHFNILPVYGLNCHSILKHDTLVLTEAALNILESRILTHKQRARPLAEKFKYKDWKDRLLKEGYSEAEERDVQTPFI